MKERFSFIYGLYINKVVRKGRNPEDVDGVITWLTSYTAEVLKNLVASTTTLEDFLVNMPGLHPNASKITGIVCGVRVEDIEDPLMRHMRYLDKLVDELAKGKTMEKILRA